MDSGRSETFEDKVIFITGNSRSGTTMMMRIMDNHSAVHSINEPHFFEKLWSPVDVGKPVKLSEAKDLYLKLLVGQREGFFESVTKHGHKYKSDLGILEDLPPSRLTRLAIYRMFLRRETAMKGKALSCEKTPQNVFYIREILRYFPNARVINMIRDPRGVMLSQKKKWKRRKLGADFITPREVIRLRINYHPITIGKLWNSAVSAVEPFFNEERVKNIRFEDLLRNPEDTVRELSKFLDIPYEKGMLRVPHAGSSVEKDRKHELGIKKMKGTNWLEKGLSPTEVSICQQICQKSMYKHGYESIEVKVSYPEKLWHYAIFLPKLGLALLFNLSRMRSVLDTLQRRIKPTG